MHSRGLATCAVLGTLVASGCGGDEQQVVTAVEPATTPDVGAQPAPATTTPAPTGGSALAELSRRDQKALAALAQTQATLIQRGDDVAVAGADADKVVQRVADGYQAPSGSQAPEVGRLARALAGFASTLGPMVTNADLLPRLSTELKLRYEKFAKGRRSVAARLLRAKQEVDAVLAAIPGLQRQLDAAVAKAQAQSSELTVDASELQAAITDGARGATTALNGVNRAIEAGFAALAAAA